MISTANVDEDPARLASVLTCRHLLGRREKIKEMVRRPGAVREARLRRANVEFFIQCDRVAVDDLSLKVLGKG